MTHAEALRASIAADETEAAKLLTMGGALQKRDVQQFQRSLDALLGLPRKRLILREIGR